ncbi:glycerol-3-phosphate acyltransferase, partial [Vibrio diabolicus]|nr:glycerol-3-phosphate acyltransferase [Vibrio diabolicus]
MDAMAVTMTIIAYLLGSISSAVLICRVLRLPDPRGVGSNNPGATNVLRIGGKGAAAAVLLCD